MAFAGGIVIPSQSLLGLGLARGPMDSGDFGSKPVWGDLRFESGSGMQGAGEPLLPEGVHLLALVHGRVASQCARSVFARARAGRLRRAAAVNAAWHWAAAMGAGVGAMAAARWIDPKSGRSLRDGFLCHGALARARQAALALGLLLERMESNGLLLERQEALLALASKAEKLADFAMGASAAWREREQLLGSARKARACSTAAKAL